MFKRFDQLFFLLLLIMQFSLIAEPISQESDAVYDSLLTQIYNNPAEAEEIITFLQKGSNSGNVKYQYLLGSCYLRGYVVEIDSVKAFELFKKAAEGGHPSAQYNMAVFHKLGVANASQDDKEVFSWLLKASENDHLEAQIKLTMSYFAGIGTEQNDSLGMYWFERASSHLSPTEQKQFAQMLGISPPTQADPESEKLFKQLKADADKGDDVAQYELAVWYQKGRYVEQDFDKAFAYLLMSEKTGNLDALVNIGSCYMDGSGVKVNERRGFEHFLKAAQAGHPVGESNLALCYDRGVGVDKDVKKAKKWHKKAGEHGYLTSIKAMAFIHSKKDKDIHYWLEKGSELGDGECMALLGLRYEGGIGVKEDKEKALKLYASAADRGSDLARERLAEMLTKEKE